MDTSAVTAVIQPVLLCASVSPCFLACLLPFLSHPVLVAYSFSVCTKKTLSEMHVCFLQATHGVCFSSPGLKWNVCSSLVVAIYFFTFSSPILPSISPQRREGLQKISTCLGISSCSKGKEVRVRDIPCSCCKESHMKTKLDICYICVERLRSF